MRIAFDEFVLDSEQRRLLAAEREIRLAPKGFDLLKLLLDERPRALSKQEIFQRLWPDTFVTDNTLATLIGDLRVALGDSAQRPRFIRTVYAYGYAFAGEAAPVAPSAGTASWKLVYEHREIPLHEGRNVLGRGGPGVVVLESSTISRQHAVLTIAGDLATIEDLGSKNGTWVGKAAVTGPMPVKDGQEVRLGSVVAVLRFEASAPSTETVGGRTP